MQFTGASLRRCTRSCSSSSSCRICSRRLRHRRRGGGRRGRGGGHFELFVRVFAGLRERRACDFVRISLSPLLQCLSPAPGEYGIREKKISRQANERTVDGCCYGNAFLSVIGQSVRCSHSDGGISPIADRTTR